jgi:hypothetical protein
LIPFAFIFISEILYLNVNIPPDVIQLNKKNINQWHDIPVGNISFGFGFSGRVAGEK